MSRKNIRVLVWILLWASTGCVPRSATPESTPWRSSAPAEATATATAAGGCIPAGARRDEARVTGITDGDSIQVEMNGVPFRVRYIGIDAPEMDGGLLAEESRAANMALVASRTVLLIRDLSEADRYGRLLRYVLVDGVFVNHELVRLGLARAGHFPPDTACDPDLRVAEEEARLAGRGIWGLIGSPTRGAETGASCAGGCVTPPPGCVIKGNISADGEKIYHMPGQKYYEKTVIEPEKGERWFCTEAEAVAAGWRRSKV
ncbi:MAG: thermonuclease family protein [Anaerolineales bacterium]|nr:thermonuclease family protein [Anaerolineales bacterium]